METNGPAVDLLSRLSEYYNTGMAGMQQGMQNQCQGKLDPAWYRGVFSDDELEILRSRTRERQRTAFEALKASGKSLLSTPVKKRDSTSK